MSWRDDLNYGLAAFGIQIPQSVPFDQGVSDIGDRPATNTTSLIAASSVLFFMAERDHNAKVNDIYDAIFFCSSCCSVGYSDIFPRTPAGKLIGSVLMTLGPALTHKFLDGPATDPRDAVQEAMLATLKEILAKLSH